MARTLADMERDLGPMREAWTGEAADAYARAQHRWRTSMVRMVTALAAATRLLAQSEQALARTEAGIAGQWPG
ncbi:MAG TPA: WXG100 family type VII secretion target, partial [Cellulomonas sp.]